MQSLGTVTETQLKSSVQQPRTKIEIFYGGAWVNLSSLAGINYLKEWSFSLGAEVNCPDPVAGSWGAILDNSDSPFHPLNTSSAYCSYLTTGTKVRLSIGGVYGGATTYWERFRGVIDSVEFTGDPPEVKIAGLDYSYYLSRKELKSQDNYWGAIVTLSTLNSIEPLGSDVYDEADALEIGVHEADNVTGWTVKSNATIASIADGGAGSTWVAEIISTGAGAYVSNINVGTLGAGKLYKITFSYKIVSGSGELSAFLYDPWSGTDDTRYSKFKYGDGTRYGSGLRIASITGLTSGDYVTATMYGTARNSEAHKFRFDISGGAGTTVRVDNISIKEVQSSWNRRYGMPANCTGIYYCIYNGSPLWYGATPDGWYYDLANNEFYFSPDMHVLAGTNNLLLYYYTAQTPEYIVADILVSAGLYSSRTDALSAMDYTASGTTIDRVWFDAGTSCYRAISKICERINYRFWFKYDGTPYFKPAPAAKIMDLADAAFEQCHVSTPNYYEDPGEIINRFVIEGEEEAQPVGLEQTETSRRRGSDSDAASIVDYGERTKTITNILFQTDAVCSSMASTLLALYKDPKKYIDFSAPFNGYPIEMGDTVRIQMRLMTASGMGRKYAQFKYGDGTKYGSNGTIVVRRGIVRDIKVDSENVLYSLEEAN